MENPAAETGDKLSQTAITKVASTHPITGGFKIPLMYNDH